MTLIEFTFHKLSCNLYLYNQCIFDISLCFCYYFVPAGNKLLALYPNLALSTKGMLPLLHSFVHRGHFTPTCQNYWKSVRWSLQNWMGIDQTSVNLKLLDQNVTIFCVCGYTYLQQQLDTGLEKCVLPRKQT